VTSGLGTPEVNVIGQSEKEAERYAGYFGQILAEHCRVKMVVNTKERDVTGAKLSVMMIKQNWTAEGGVAGGIVRPKSLGTVFTSNVDDTAHLPSFLLPYSPLVLLLPCWLSVEGNPPG
jgi:hypothetical protein